MQLCRVECWIGQSETGTADQELPIEVDALP